MEIEMAPPLVDSPYLQVLLIKLRSWSNDKKTKIKVRAYLQHVAAYFLTIQFLFYVDDL